MLTRPFGDHGVAVSELGFGCAGWWGRRAFSETEAIRLVHAALDGGVTFLDTGASYGKGVAEARLGRALRGQNLDRLIIATKAGTDFVDGRLVRDFSPVGVAASIERSRSRLGIDQIPLLQLHGPSLPELGDELFASLERSRQAGHFRWLGINSFDTPVLEWAIASGRFDTVMLDYNVLRPERTSLIADAARRGMAVLAGMPLAMGHLDRQVLKLSRPRDLWYAARGWMRHRREVADGARFGFLRQLEGWSPAQAALAYVLENPGVSCAVAGTTRDPHLRELLATPGRRLPEGTLEDIARVQAELGLTIVK